MTYYIGLIIIAYLCLICSLSSKGISLLKVSTAFVFVIAWTILALRGNSVGTDTVSYIKIFQTADSMSIVDLLQNYFGKETMDIVFLIYVKVISVLTDSSQIMLAISGGIYLYFAYKFIKYSQMGNPIYGLWYLCLAPYLTSFNLVRQCMALGFCMMSWICYEKERKKSVLFFLIGVLFHFSAVIWGITFIVKKIKPSKKMFMGLLGGIAFFSVLAEKIIYFVLSFFPVYQYRYGENGAYSDLTTQASGSIVLWMVIFACSIFLAFTSKWKNEKDRSTFESIIYSVIAIAFLVIGNSVGGVQRLAIYFQPFWIVVLKETGYKLKPKWRMMYILCVSVCAVFFFLLQIQTDQYSPYVFFWND